MRTVAECAVMAQSDVTVQTALLESRYLCGSRRVFNHFRRVNAQVMDPKAFLRAKTLEMRQRHQKYEETPYSLEPNCKESPGGLRDLQVVIWVARAAGLGKNWAALAANGLITPFEVKQLQRNEGLLKLIRARLHTIAGRREDRLVFDLQTAIAESFGYRSTAVQRASEKLMRRYYWAAKAVTQLNQILMLNIEERIERLAGRADAADQRALPRTLAGCSRSPATTSTSATRTRSSRRSWSPSRPSASKGLSARTLRALYNARDLMDAEFRHDPVNRATFMAILKESVGQTHAFRLMNQTSVLGRYLWVFRRIVGQMQHDLFHVYTVDQHILMVLRNVRRFLIPEHAHEYPFCSQLASTWDRPYVLYIAALFHDVAKGRGGDHSELGMREARHFCRDHGLDREDTRADRVPGRPAPDDVAHRAEGGPVGSRRDPGLRPPGRHRAPADRAVPADGGRHPRHQPEGLERMEGQAARGPVPPHVARARRRPAEPRCRDRGAQAGGPPPAQPGVAAARRRASALEDARAQLLRAPRCRRHRLACALAARAGRTTQPIVRARLSSLGEGLQVLVYAPDRQDLFARICGYFDSAGFNILDAKIHTTATAMRSTPSRSRARRSSSTTAT